MRIIIGSILILFFVASPAFGQLTELRVDGSTMDGDEIADVSITQDGVIQVTTVSGDYEIVKKTPTTTLDVVINSFSINNTSNAMLDVDATATLRWGTTNAASCSASATPAEVLDDWNSTTILGDLGPKAVNFPNAGIYNLRLDCVGTNGSTDSKIVTAQVGSANITSFTVTPKSAEIGTDVTLKLAWSSENTEAGCSGSANWPNSTSLPSSGTRTFIVSNIQAGTEFELTCFSAFDEDSSIFKINVTTPQPANCSAPLLTSSTNRVWTQVFSDAWPGPKSSQVRLTVPTRGYYSVSFNTGNVSDDGFFTNIEASGTVGYRLGSVSECPGDFSDAVPAECTYKWGDNGGIFWDTEGGPGNCKLKKNTTYYWNMTFTDGVNPNSSRCIGTYCETYFQVSNR